MPPFSPRPLALSVSVLSLILSLHFPCLPSLSLLQSSMPLVFYRSFILVLLCSLYWHPWPSVLYCAPPPYFVCVSPAPLGLLRLWTLLSLLDPVFLSVWIALLSSDLYYHRLTSSLLQVPTFLTYSLVAPHPPPPPLPLVGHPLQCVSMVVYISNTLTRQSDDILFFGFVTPPFPQSSLHLWW